MNFLTHWRRMLIGTTAGLALAGAALLTPPAQAQVGDASGLTNLMQHDYLHRDLVYFNQALELDEGQRIILESLFEDYRDAFDDGWQNIQARITDMTDDLERVGQTGDEKQILNMILEPFKDWQEEKQRLKEQFEENVKIILSPAQLEKWPAFERHIVREKTLPHGRLAGENVNLMHVVRDLNLDARTEREIESVLTEYEHELHQALQRRNDVIERGQAQYLRTLASPDESTIRNYQRQEVDRRVEVRNVNDKYMDRITEALPSDLGQEFRERALARAYPRVFRTTQVERMVDQALNVLDLDDDVRSSVEALRETIRTEMSSMNEQLLRVVREHDPRAYRNRAEMMLARRTGSEVSRIEDPTRELFQKRDEQARQYIDQLRDILPEQQFLRLPGAAQMARTARQQQLDEARREQRDRERGGADPRRRGGAGSPRGERDRRSGGR